MKRRPLLVAALLAALEAGSAGAMTTARVPQTCPVGGEKFTAVLAMSGSQFGQNLDRRPWGAIASPWPLAKCPANGFVLFKETFTPAELETLTPFVLSPEYQALQARETDYYLAVRLMERTKQPAPAIARAALAATWEVETDPRYARYTDEALGRYQALLLAPPAGTEANVLVSYGQIAAELERRLGRFDAARQRVARLLDDPAAKGTPLEPVLRQEMELIEGKDSATHRIGENEKAGPGRTRGAR